DFAIDAADHLLVTNIERETLLDGDLSGFPALVTAPLAAVFDEYGDDGGTVEAGPDVCVYQGSLTGPYAARVAEIERTPGFRFTPLAGSFGDTVLRDADIAGDELFIATDSELRRFTL